MVRDSNRFWRTPDGRSTRALRLAGLAAGMSVVTALDLLLLGRPNPLSYVVAFVVFVAVGRLLDDRQVVAAPGANRFWQFPIRLSPGRARVVIELGLLTLVLAAGGVLASEGLARVVYAAMFLAIGLTNVAWGLGSLLPEGRGARFARWATLPLTIAMVLAMVAYVALRVSERL